MDSEGRSGCSKSGWIEDITLTNFMCHSYVKVEFNKNVNFITGQNGSGKSAILTALCVAFGTKARSTQRASNIKDFIKSGQSYAVIEVKLNNEAVDAYKPENFGKAIIVERRITISGASQFTVKDYRGRKVTMKKNEVEDIASHFLIEVDNPCLIMTQDKSREFLHSGSEKDKFKFFVKATLLERVIQVLSDVSSGIQMGVGLLEQLKADVRPLEEKIKKLASHVEDMQELENMQGNIDRIKKLLAWSFVEKDKETLEEAAGNMEEVSRKLEECEVEISRAIEAKAQQEEMILESQARLREGSSGQEELTRKQDELSRDFSKASRLRSQLQVEYESKVKALNENQLEMSQLKELMKRAEEQLMQDSQAEEVMKKNEIQVKEAELFQASDSHGRLEEHAKALDSKIWELEKTKRDLTHQVQENEKRQRDCHGWLRRLQQQAGSSNTLEKFGGQQVSQLLQLIQQNSQNFEMAPIGPIGAYLGLVDDRYAMAVEVAIGGRMSSFIVSSMRDNKILQNLAKKINMNLPTIIYNYNIPPINPPPDSVPDPSLLTVEKALIIENPVVRNVLIDLSSIERTVLVRDYNEGKIIAFERGSNIVNCIDEGGLRMFVREGQQCTVKKPPGIKSARLKKDFGVDLREAEGEISQLKEENIEKKRELGLVERGLKENEEEKRRRQREVENVGRKVWNLRREIDRLKMEIRREEERRIGTDVGEYEAQIEVLATEIETLTSKLEGLEVQISQASEVEEICRAKSAEAAAQVKQFFNDLDKMEEQHIALETELRKRQKRVDQFRAYKDGLKEKLEGFLEAQNKAKEKFEECQGKALRYCPEPSLEDWQGQPKNSAILQNRLVEMQRKKDQHQQNLERQGVESLEEAQHRLEKMKKRKEKREAQVILLEERFSRLKVVFKERRKGLKTAMECLKRDINWKFNERLHRKGAKGKISIDFQEQTLALEIHLPSDTSGFGVKDTRALSGGERSFSTLCYALALHDMADSPFRAMDEFDVFMDNVTRKICLEEAVKFAIQSGVQWIFITPHDVSSVEAGPLVTKQEMPSPRH